jgi:hypothetical protein
VQDWGVKPFVDIKVQNKPCSGDYNADVFYKEWKGMDEGCVKLNDDSDKSPDVFSQ